MIETILQKMSSQPSEYVDTLRNLSESMRRSTSTSKVLLSDESNVSTSSFSIGSPISENSILQPKTELSSVKLTVKLETEALATTGDNQFEEALNPNSNRKSTVSFNCFDCMRSFKTFCGLGIHLASSSTVCGKRYKCIPCNVGFMKRSDFVLHKSSASHTGVIIEKKFICEKCSPVRKFSSKR
eukprot:210672_1